MATKIGILDYGAGNLMNMVRAVEYLDYSPKLVKLPAHLDEVDKLIIPGVGAFKSAMDSISECKLIDPVRNFAKVGKPVLGICLGMQLLFDRSYEFGETDGLGLLRGEVKRISDFLVGNRAKVKIPHVGWGELSFKSRHVYFTDNIPNEAAFYFVHSYMCLPLQTHTLIATCEYGNIEIPSIVGNKNIYGCQFHPEKSGTVGLNMLKEFLGGI